MDSLWPHPESADGLILPGLRQRQRSSSQGQALLPHPPLPSSESALQHSAPRAGQDAPSDFSPASPFSLASSQNPERSDALPVTLSIEAEHSMHSPSDELFSSQIHSLFNPTLPSPEQPVVDLGTLLDQVVSQQGEIQRGYDEALRLTLPTGKDERDGPLDSVIASEREQRVTRRIPRGDRMMMRLMRHYVEVVGPWVSIIIYPIARRDADGQDGACSLT
jgi:hypothetical protein